MELNLLGKDILPEGGRAAHQFINYAILHMYSAKSEKWRLASCAISSMKNHFVRWYLVASEEELKKYLDDFEKDPALLKELKNYTTETRDKGINFVKQDFSKVSNATLAQAILQHEVNCEALIRSAGVLRSIDLTLVPKLRSIFQNQSNVDEAIAIASTSSRAIFLASEQLALLKLAVKLAEKKDSLESETATKGIKQIHSNYCWSTCGYYDEPARTIAEYKTMLEELLKSNPGQKLKDLNEKAKEEKIKRQNLLKHLTPRDKLTCKIASESVYLKDYYKASINQLALAAEPMFAEIGRRTGKSPDFVKDLLPEEIVQLLTSGKIDEENIKKRAKHSILVVQNNSFTILTGIEAEEFEKNYLTPKHNKTNEIKGRVASTGLGRGTVKVVLGSSEFNKFKPGNVLVVLNTSPDYAKIVKMASAIIAEDGGVTAHVSVISREFQVPCIVGVKNATTLFKDGDKVEVDANKGVVKKLG